jgi:hypothetical protein
VREVLDRDPQRAQRIEPAFQIQESSHAGMLIESNRRGNIVQADRGRLPYIAAR